MRWNAAVAALAASWGLVSVIVAGVELDATTLVFYRQSLTALVLAAAVRIAGGASVFRIPRPRVRPVLAGVVLGTALAAVLETIKLSSVAFAILVVYAATGIATMAPA